MSSRVGREKDLYRVAEADIRFVINIVLVIEVQRKEGKDRETYGSSK